jgi:hypothetical protein
VVSAIVEYHFFTDGPLVSDILASHIHIIRLNDFIATSRMAKYWTKEYNFTYLI